MPVPHGVLKPVYSLITLPDKLSIRQGCICFSDWAKDMIRKIVLVARSSLLQDIGQIRFG